MTPRRLLPALALAATALLAALPAHAAIYVYSAMLDGRQEVPPTATSGQGVGRFIIDTNANTVTYRIYYVGMTNTVTAGHIHGNATSGPGLTAGVLHTFTGNAFLDPPLTGVWNYSEPQEAMILDGMCYANLHTSTFPGGEIRGQIVPFNAQLDQRQEVPLTGSTGLGWGVFKADTAANTIRYHISYSGLTGAPSAAHFHGNALHGANAGVKLTIPVTASPMSGTLSYLQADEAALLSGRWYVNLHTAAFPGGEIRGQVSPIVIPLDGGQEVPANSTLAGGYVMVAMDTLANALSYNLQVLSLGGATETAAHIHGFSAASANAGVQTALGAGLYKAGTWVYGAANEQNVLDGLTYFNIHTNTFPGGMIRGQLDNLQFSNGNLGVGGTPRLTSGLAAAPNPFGRRTVLSFALARTGRVAMSVVGVDGRVVREFPEATFAPGTHSFEWDGLDSDGRNVAPGVYFAVVRGPEGTKTTRLARLQ